MGAIFPQQFPRHVIGDIVHVFHVTEHHQGAVHKLFIITELSCLVLLGNTVLAEKLMQLFGAAEQFIGFAPKPFIELRYGTCGGGHSFMNPDNQEIS